MSVERTSADSGMATAFGFRDVGEGEKIILRFEEQTPATPPAAAEPVA